MDFCFSGRGRRTGSQHGQTQENGRSADFAGVEDCFAFGMKYASGAGVPVDLVQAHVWFNIAAARGHREATRLRREVAEQMTGNDIGQAQRAARTWLQAHHIAA